MSGEEDLGLRDSQATEILERSDSGEETDVYKDSDTEFNFFTPPTSPQLTHPSSRPLGKKSSSKEEQEATALRKQLEAYKFPILEPKPDPKTFPLKRKRIHVNLSKHYDDDYTLKKILKGRLFDTFTPEQRNLHQRIKNLKKKQK
jgi:hypothetical protein